MTEQWQLMEWANQSRKKWQANLKNIFTSHRQEMEADTVITDGVLALQSPLAQMSEHISAAFDLSKEIRGRRNCLEGMIKEIQTARSRELRQDRLATVLMMIDPEIAALNPSIVRDFLFSMDGPTMKKAFGPGGLLVDDKRLMMLRQLQDLQALIEAKK